MIKKPELDSLLSDYRKVKNISCNVVNETLVHNTEFHCWLSNVVIDTINYEKLLLDILKYECKYFDVKNIAEVYSRPILSVSEKISNEFVPTLNYNYYINELGESDEYQANNNDLFDNISSIDLLIGQSHQYENLMMQRDKLTIIRNFILKKDKPFIYGCYGNLNNEHFKKRIAVLEDFEDRLDSEVNVYNETINGIDCKVLVKI